MKVTTKTGDDGMTDFYNKRIEKSSLDLEALGQVDELIAALCLYQPLIKEPLAETIISSLSAIANIIAEYKDNDVFLEGAINELELIIDKNQDKYDDFKFVYPLNHSVSASYNYLRVLTRKCERALFCLKETKHLSQQCTTYLNRLSDYFYLQLITILDTK